MLMAVRPSVDFYEVRPGHEEIDDRLKNWARWCHGTNGRTCQPMFRLYRAAEHWGQHDTGSSVDTLDATAIQKAVSGLPDGHRKAVSWCYVIRSNPKKVAQSLAVSMEGLLLLIHDGRTILINRLTP